MARVPPGGWDFRRRIWKMISAACKESGVSGRSTKSPGRLQVIAGNGALRPSVGWRHGAEADARPVSGRKSTSVRPFFTSAAATAVGVGVRPERQIYAPGRSDVVMGKVNQTAFAASVSPVWLDSVFRSRPFTKGAHQ